MAELNKNVEEEGKDGEKLRDDLSVRQKLLVDTEMENRRHRAFDFQISKFDTNISNEIPFFSPMRKFFFENLLYTKTDLIKIQGKEEKFDIVEHCA